MTLNNIFTTHDGLFYQDGKPVFLNSGEIHYFRIKHHLWDTHLTETQLLSAISMAG